MQSLSKIFLVLAALCLIGALGVLLFGAGLAATGIFVVGFLVALAIGGMGHAKIKPHVFTIWVLASVIVALYFPQYFLNVGDFQLTGLIKWLIMIIMFGMGTSMSLQDFAGVAKMPKGILVGLVCQFTIMPLVGLTLAKTFGFEAEIAAGIVLIGSVSGGVASNVMAYIAKANLALSITMTAVSTVVAPLMTPLLMQLLANQFIAIDFVAMMISVAQIVLLPIALGLLVNKLLAERADLLHKVMPLLSMGAIVVVLAIIVAAGREDLLVIGPLLFFAAILHNAIGYVLGYWGCRMLGMNEQDSRTISLEVGMQNGGLATALAAEMGKAATVGLAPAIFGPWMNVSGSALANWWRGKPAEGAGTQSEVESPEEASI